MVQGLGFHVENVEISILSLFELELFGWEKNGGKGLRNFHWVSLSKPRKHLRIVGGYLFQIGKVIPI